MQIGNRAPEMRVNAFRVYLRNSLPDSVEQLARVLSVHSTRTYALVFEVMKDLENASR